MEEGPITVAPLEIRKNEDGAVNIGKLVNYSGAGTVEYLYRPDTGELSFLVTVYKLNILYQKHLELIFLLYKFKVG